MSLLVVSEAAKRLGVSTRQVQHLVARGELRQVARGMLEESSVERFVAIRGGSHKTGLVRVDCMECGRTFVGCRRGLDGGVAAVTSEGPASPTWRF